MVKNIIFFLFLMSIWGCENSKQNNNIFFFIKKDYEEYDLQNCRYIVKRIDKEDYAVKFNLSVKEKKEIINLYYQYDIDQIYDDYMVRDKCIELPKEFTTIIIKDVTEKKIKIDYDCQKYKSYRDKKVKLFLNELYKILENKEEIKNAPKANYLNL